MRNRPLSLFVTVIAALSAIFVACSNQGEGERCDTDNNNDDCQSGLQCVRGNELGLAYDICCPPNRAEATPGTRCATGASGIGDASTPTPDTGAPSDAAVDADADGGQDSATDAPVDATTDAPDGD